LRRPPPPQYLRPREPSGAFFCLERALNYRFSAKLAEYVHFYACVIILASSDNASAGPEILLASGYTCRSMQELWQIACRYTAQGETQVTEHSPKPMTRNGYAQIGAFYCLPESDIKKLPNRK
jgi:hypothetical protein